MVHLLSQTLTARTYSGQAYLVDIERFKATEEEGRRRASEREDLPQNDALFLQKVYFQAKMMEERFDEFGLYNEARLAEMVKMAAYWAVPEVRACILGNIRRKDCIIARRELEDGMVWWKDLSGHESLPYASLHSADTSSIKLTGRRCTYLRGAIDPYNESSFLNDLTSCFHTAMDIYRDKLGKWRRKGKCFWVVV